MIVGIDLDTYAPYPVVDGKIYAPFTKTEAIRPDEIIYQDVTFIGLERFIWSNT